MEKLTSLLSSRRFMVAISSLALVFTNEYDLNISEDSMLGIVGLAMAWILGDSLRKT